MGDTCHPGHVKIGVRVNEQYSKEFGVGVGVHQGSVLSPLLFIMVLEALSREFRIDVPWEILYADDLIIIADSMGECITKLKAWKANMEEKGLRVNMKKTKILVSGFGLDQLQDSNCRTQCVAEEYAQNRLGAPNVNSGYTRSVVALLGDCLQIRNLAVQDVVVRLVQSMEGLKPNWTWTEPCWMSKPASVTWEICYVREEVVNVRSLPDIAQLGASSGDLYPS